MRARSVVRWCMWGRIARSGGVVGVASEDVVHAILDLPLHATRRPPRERRGVVVVVARPAR